jgi:hypothetical protein
MKFCPACGTKLEAEEKTEISEPVKKSTVGPTVCLIIFAVIAIIGALLVGLRSDFGQELWKHCEYEYTGATIYGNYTGHLVVNVGISKLTSPDECIKFVRTVGIVQILVGVIGAGISTSIVSSRRR